MEENSCLSKEFQLFLENNIKDYKNFKCKAAVLSNFGGCLVAKQSVNEGEELLRIPETLFITLSVAITKLPILREVKSNLNVQKKSILAFFLFKEKKDASSFYHCYLNSIPKQYTNTITWQEIQFNLLRDELKTKHQKKQQKLLSEFDAIKNYISSNKDYSHIFEGINEAEFLQLVAMIESRTLFFKNEQDSTSEVGAMIPFYDLANHTFMEGIDHFKYFYFDQISKEYVMRAYKHFVAEEQIFITYGNYNNEHFLDYYGFIPFNNQREALQFTIQSDQLPKILGKDFTKKLRENSLIGQQILNHFYAGQNLKPNIVIEIEEASQSFSWETITFLQVFSLDLDINQLKTTSETSKQKSNKFDNKSSKQPAKSTSQKSQLAAILEAFNSNQIENQSYFNQQLYKQYAQNIKQYLQSLYKDIKFSEKSIDINQNQFCTLLATDFTQKEMKIVDNCKF
ncbi:SET domain protein (macronuclear) [Tetrahymena thermophila SB210]|uniref:SET domain protein n=1 Tax=Tetrahymena thermophila (strain SB210) TaxID=312017 RepID=Q233R8_TETTS|nr:SET domain protein [Tetrahymena thermophila SB210]EAR91761.1 SET domain protein [Tetrahymena thermophila SB210]|eukprot:XP_001012006.1 SET domain protein [Tetrahymena thermophila SB210]